MYGMESAYSVNIYTQSNKLPFFFKVHLILTVCAQLILHWQPTDLQLIAVCSPALQMDLGSGEAQLDQTQSQSKLMSG